MFGFFRTALALIAISSLASAEPQVWVEQGRIKLADIAQAPPRLSELDLGPSPPPGGSRLISRSEVEDELRSLGEDPRLLKLEAVVRVTRRSKQRSAEELREWLQPAIEQALPPGVHLQQFRLRRPLVTPVHASVGRVVVPRLPRRAGITSVTATVEILDDGDIFVRVPAPLRLEISPEGAQPAVARGERVDLVIERGPATISAVAVTLQDLDVGDIGSFRVVATQRLLRARLTSKTLASVVQ